MPVLTPFVLLASIPLLATFEWNADPDLFRVGPVAVRWYGLLFATGFIVGFQYLRRMLAREDKPDKDADAILIHTIVGTLVGARLLHCLVYHPREYLADPVSILKIWEGGLASHGAAIGILLALWLYSRKRPEQPFLWVVDRVAVLTAFGAFCIRLGNFFNSEIIGTPTDAPWAVVFQRRDLLPRHPVQLYESLTYLVIFFVLHKTYQRLGASTPNGLLVGLFLTLVFAARFVLEFVKIRQTTDSEGLPLSYGQLLSIPAVALGVWLIWRARRRPVVAA